MQSIAPALAGREAMNAFVMSSLSLAQASGLVLEH